VNTGTVKNDAIVAAVKNVFGDGSCFHRIRLDKDDKDYVVYGWIGEVDGVKIGIVAATKTPRWADSAYFILNKGDFDKLVAGDRIDQAFVVTAKIDQFGTFTFVDMIKAHELAAILVNVKPRTGGALGDYYRVDGHFSNDGEGF
jgi:hypothetical protein